VVIPPPPGERADVPKPFKSSESLMVTKQTK
jgi:hypothetical protein